MLDTFYNKNKEGLWTFLAIFQGTYVMTVGAYMRLGPPWRAILFTHCSIEFPVLRQWLIPSSLSRHFYYYVFN